MQNKILKIKIFFFILTIFYFFSLEELNAQLEIILLNDAQLTTEGLYFEAHAQKVKEYGNASQIGFSTFDFSDLNEGMYFLKTKTDAIKFIKSSN